MESDSKNADSKIPAWKKLGLPKPNCIVDPETRRWMREGVEKQAEQPRKQPPTGLEPEDQYRMPQGTAMVQVDGDCLEPAIRDGQIVFVYPHDGGEISPGTPVMASLTNGERLIKLWHGIEGGYTLLRYLNSDRTGRPGMLFIPVDKISEIWIVGGLWFNGVPFLAERPMRGIRFMAHERLIDEIQREEEAIAGACPQTIAESIATGAEFLENIEEYAHRDKRASGSGKAANAHTLPAPKPSPASKKKPDGKTPSSKRSA